MATNPEAPPEDDLMLELKQKKKKKKKKQIDIETLLHQPQEAPPPEPPTETQAQKPTVQAPSTAAESEAASTAAAVPTPAVLIDDFELPKKKKRRRPNITFEGFDVAAVLVDVEAFEEKAEGGEEEDEPTDNSPWANSDRDYTYEELLERVFNIMKQKNPSMVGGQKKKLVMKPPQVVRVGAKKTSFVNFTDICKLLHRQPKHVLAFLMSELGTSGSVDGNNQLIIKGKFQQKQIETVLRRYIKEYVTCHTCRSPDTILQKETRLFFLQCETCGSRCSVQSIKSGFQAVTNRAQLRRRQ